MRKLAFLLIALAVFGLYTLSGISRTEWMHDGHYFEMFAIAGVFALILLPNI